MRIGLVNNHRQGAAPRPRRPGVVAILAACCSSLSIVGFAACTQYRVADQDGAVNDGSGAGGAKDAADGGGAADGRADGGPVDHSSACVTSDQCPACETCATSGQCVSVIDQDDPVVGRCAGTCDHTGMCRSRKGQLCTAVNAGCASGTSCSDDGYCCDVSCKGPCVACDIPGKQGTCTALGVNGAPHQGHGACAGGGTACAGSCDGAGSCSYPTPVCSTGTTCMNGQLVDQNVCSNGSCVAPPAHACAGNFICSGTACKTSCATSADCLPDYFCGAGTCHLDASAIAAGGSHVCALLLDGTVRCWGSNSSGQLGNSAVATSSVPIQVNTATGALSGVTAIAAGGSHSCALISDGTIRCWGDNSSGQLGNPSVTSATSTVPVTVSVSGATAIASSGYGACALVAGGAVKCWGANDSGQLGNPTFAGATSSTPLAVAGVAGATRIVGASGGNHTCAMAANGTAQCWGADGSGQLGDGGMSSTPMAAIVQSGLNGISAMTAGLYHTCVIISGQIRCWGGNSNAQLGNTATTSAYSLTPVVVGSFSSATAVSAALLHTCALLSAGSVFCWGANFNGELGDSTLTTSSSSTPVYVSGLSGVTAISGGSYHTCVLLMDGSVACWGQNGDGRLGNGSIGNSPMPVAVTGW